MEEEKKKSLDEIDYHRRQNDELKAQIKPLENQIDQMYEKVREKEDYLEKLKNDIDVKDKKLRQK